MSEQQVVTERTFQPWPKTPRLNRDCIVTEKIDGTNSAIVIDEVGDVYAQSRNRLITPGDDNYGFAALRFLFCSTSFCAQDVQVFLSGRATSLRHLLHCSLVAR